LLPATLDSGAGVSAGFAGAFTASGSGVTVGLLTGAAVGLGARIFEIGGKTGRVSELGAVSAFFGRFSSINETVSGLGAGAAGAGSVLAGAASFALALLIGGTPLRFAGLSSAAVLVSVIGFFVFGEIRSVVVLRAVPLLAAGSGLSPDLAGESFRVLARVTMNDLSL
jgi:hypothetical protein